MRSITPQALKPRLSSGEEIAFLDVREHGQYGEGHPFFSVPLPYSRLEAEAPRLLPCRKAPVVLLDDGDGVGDRAASRLEALGYADISVVAGGAPAWAETGFTLYKGVNVPSKAFGELLEHKLSTPRIGPAELAEMQAKGTVIVLDGRTPAEFRKMSIPGARSCPNAELPYRSDVLWSDPKTPIVVNCAGRTRSILGTENLRAARVPNPVYALENGTQGWRLAGFQLAHGETPTPLPGMDANALARSADRAKRIMEHHAIPAIDTTTLRDWLADDDRTTYALDVRTAEEFVAGHLPGFLHAPGGQLVQATDEKVAVRGARIILACDTGLRAAITAMWLRSMGHDAHVLSADASEGAETGAEASPPSPGGTIALESVRQRVAEGAELIDCSRSMDFRAGHPAGARWVNRARLPSGSASPAVVLAQDGWLAALVAGDLAEMGRTVWHASYTPDTARAAGLDILETPDNPPDDRCIDYLFFVHDRHDGNLAAARAYLEWETGLLGQLDEQERAILTPPERHA